MPSIAIVGAGQAGTLLAVGLQRAGHEVTVLTDRTAESLLNDGPPTGTAALFAEAVAVERRLGVDTYEDRCPPLDAIHLFFGPRVGVELIGFGAPLEGQSGFAVDVRLKSYDRLRQLESAGGKVLVETVTVDRLDDVAAEHDLTLVATGRGGLAELFPRDEVRSVYNEPQRQLAMVVATGISTGPAAFPHRIGGRPVCFNFFGDAGEMFWVPWLHKTAGPCWNLVFEARAGGRFDRFRGCRSQDEAFDVARSVVRQLCPWDWEVMKDMEPVAGDPHAWLVGAVRPAVRSGSGLTPGGRPVMSLGDTTASFDPIGGQGAGSGTRQAGAYFDAIEARGGRPFDRAWMDDTFEAFWAWHGDGTYRLNNVLLEPLDKTGIKLMKACFARPELAKAFLGSFGQPPTFFPWVADPVAADRWIAERSGQPAWRVVGAGMARIIAGQARQKLRGRHFPYAEGPAAAGPALH